MTVVVEASAPEPTSAMINEAPTALAPPASAMIDDALTALSAKKLQWAQLPMNSKIKLLDAVRLRLADKMVSWGRAGAHVKGTDDESLVVGEMLTSVAVPATYIHKLLTTLRSLRDTGKAPTLPCRTTASGQKAVKVFPLSWSDKHSLLQPGSTAELYLLPEEGAAGQGQAVRQAVEYGSNGAFLHEGRLCAVLGAGNHGFLTVKDALYCLYERGEVVAIKPHPIMAEWHAIAEYVLEPLVKAGYVRTLYLANPAETQGLLHHPLVDCVHMTGGTVTHDAIVWGSSPEEQQRRRKANDPLLKVPITSELGCVSPFIVAGWQFTPEQLTVQANNLVVAMTSNNGCNCNSAKVLVLPGDWPQAAAFLETVRSVLRGTPHDPPYYPGIHERYAAFKARYPRCEAIQGPAKPATRPLGPTLPYLINVLDGVPEDPKAEYAFSMEPFAPVLTVVTLPTEGAPAFLAAATALANESLWGSLSCTLVLHPGLEAAHPAEAQQAVDSLRYGVVAVNAWSAASCILGSCTWGAFEGGQTAADVGSGMGVVGNPFMVEGVQKAVYRTVLDGEAVPKPMHLKPIPLVAARLVLGFVVDGWRGLLRGAWAR